MEYSNKFVRNIPLYFIAFTHNIISLLTFHDTKKLKFFKFDISICLATYLKDKKRKCISFDYNPECNLTLMYFSIQNH